MTVVESVFFRGKLGRRRSQHKRNKLGDGDDCFQTAVTNRTHPAASSQHPSSPNQPPLDPLPRSDPDYYYYYFYYAEQMRAANVAENCTIMGEKEAPKTTKKRRKIWAAWRKIKRIKAKRK